MYDKPSFPGFGERLKALLKQKKVTQVKLAKSINISQHTITKYLKGERKPAANILADMAEFFGVSTDWLLKGREPEISESVSETITEEAPGRMAVARENSEKTNSSELTLEKMYSILEKLMHSEDPNMRGWTIVQFKKAFGEYWRNAEERDRNYPGKKY